MTLVFNNIYPWKGIRRCNLSDAGVVNAYYGDAAFKYDGSNGQVMVEIPAFYYKGDVTPTGYQWYIANKPLSGYKIHPAFVNDGVQKNKTYVGAFEACCYDVSASAYNTTDAAGVDFTVGTGDKLASIAGVKPLSGQNNTLSLINARKLAQNRGTGWQLETYQQASALQLLYLIEYANFNSQVQIKDGVTNITDDTTTNMAVNTGYTAGVGTGGVDKGNTSGYCTISHYQTAQTTWPISYRGVENLWGNIWKWVDAINIKADRNPWIADHDFASDVFAHPYTDTGLTLSAADGYASDISINAAHDYGFLASAVTGSSTTKLCDYYYQLTGNRAARLGGNWYGGAGAGAFYWHLLAAASLVSRDVGARLAYFVG